MEASRFHGRINRASFQSRYGGKTEERIQQEHMRIVNQVRIVYMLTTTNQIYPPFEKYQLLIDIPASIR
jgi:hypothetical protein